MAELRALLRAPTTTRCSIASSRRLPDDEEKEAEYQRLMREELVASRLAAIEPVSTLLEPTLLAVSRRGAQTIAFMQSINAIRLVLGTLLGIDDDDSADDADERPTTPEHQLYDFLSWLLEWTVRALVPATASRSRGVRHRAPGSLDPPFRSGVALPTFGRAETEGSQADGTDVRGRARLADVVTSRRSGRAARTKGIVGLAARQSTAHPVGTPSLSSPGRGRPRRPRRTFDRDVLGPTPTRLQRFVCCRRARRGHRLAGRSPTIPIASGLTVALLVPAALIDMQHATAPGCVDRRRGGRVPRRGRRWSRAIGTSGVLRATSRSERCSWACRCCSCTSRRRRRWDSAT